MKRASGLEMTSLRRLGACDRQPPKSCASWGAKAISLGTSHTPHQNKTDDCAARGGLSRRSPARNRTLLGEGSSWLRSCAWRV